MFRIYSAAKIARLLSETGGPVTIKLGLNEAAWRPHPSSDRYAPAISGPAQKVTYIPTGNGQVVVDVERNARFLTLAFAPPREHSVGPMPTVAPPARRNAVHVFVGGALLIYLILIVVGFELGYAFVGNGSPIGGVAGAIAGFLAAYVVNLAVVVTLHARRVHHPPDAPPASKPRTQHLG